MAGLFWLYCFLKSSETFAILGLIFGLDGSFLLIMDYFPKCHRWINRLNPWKEINQGIKTMKIKDKLSADKKKIGILAKGESGFDHIINIIKGVRDDLPPFEVKAIILYSPESYSLHDQTIEENYIHLKYDERSPFLLCEESIFLNWIDSFRKRYFLVRGIWLILIGFFLNIIAVLRA